MIRRYPVVALGLLAAVDGFHGYALLVLAPDIGATLGIGTAAVGALALLGLASAAVLTLPLAELAARAGRRAGAAVAAGAAWAAGLAATGFVAGPWALAGLVAADGASSGASRALHPALLGDLYPERARVRALSAHRALAGSGGIVAPAVVAALTAAGLTWRGVYVALGVLAAISVVLALRVRDPRIPPAVPVALRPTVAERASGVLAVPTARRILAAYAVAGLFLAPLIGHLLVFLEARWGLGATQRGLFFVLSGAVTAGVIALFASEGERRLAQGPTALLRAAWIPAALAAFALSAAALAPSFGAAVAAFCAAFACLALAQTSVLAALLGVVEAQARTTATALAGVALAGIGGAGGLLLTAGMIDSLGAGAAVTALAIPAAAAAMLIRAAAPGADRDREVARARDSRQRDEPVASPALAIECRDLHFAYPHRPVLRGVDLAVAPGELVALLGTNGAGKTTLLRALSGLALPSAGTVLLAGHDITIAHPERRSQLGLIHVAGARSTYPGLTVTEHLRLVDPRRGSELLDELEFLRPRRRVRAEHLSAGERQLLGLARALIQRPTVLLVDEPTRSLSPEAAGAVQALLRGLAAGGTAVIAVEQSLAAAAAVASRVVFLERGEIRYDGSVEALAARRDLIRPVFVHTSAGAA